MKQTINWKAGLLFYAVISIVFFFAFFYAAFDNHFVIDHQAAITGNSNWPESYVVHISPAVAFAFTWGFSRVFGLILWIVLGLFIIVTANNLTGKFLTQKFVAIYVALTLLSGAFCFAGSSNVFARNKVTISPQQYEQVKGDNEALKALFDKNHLIK